ncbi:Hpt domain-containing protein [Phenylobacterium sp.]|uniref:Hpt domain-containing protein n=1 Tax=Phenylobacterium sp. TaxID=1871053 RepID=UPI003983688A
MAPLRARFLARAADDLAKLRGGLEPEAAGVLIHRLSGTAGVFGFDELSRLAGAVDDRRHAGQPDAAEMAALLRELESVCLKHG